MIENFEVIFAPLRSAASQLENIVYAFRRLFVAMFYSGSFGMFGSLVDFITNTPYLIVGLSLVIIGFVITIIKRIISV